MSGLRNNRRSKMVSPYRDFLLFETLLLSWAIACHTYPSAMAPSDGVLEIDEDLVFHKTEWITAGKIYPIHNTPSFIEEARNTTFAITAQDHAKHIPQPSYQCSVMLTTLHR